MKDKKKSKFNSEKKRSNYKNSKKTNKKAKKLLSPDESKIFDYLKKNMQSVFSSRELMKKCGVKNKDAFYAALKNLDSLGYVKVDKKHKVSYNVAGEEIGTVVSLSEGFAFVSCENGDEVFVPGRHLNGCFIGDKVLVVDIQDDAKGKNGRIGRVIENAENMTTGTVVKSDFGYSLVPDASIRYSPTIINPEIANINDKVYAQIVQDKFGDWTQAKIVTVFGSGDSARVCSDAILCQYNIPLDFSEEVKGQAKDISHKSITEEDLEGRLDLRDEPIFTIDSADSKDLDDAISIRKFDDYWELGVHIADVSHYIHAKTPIDNEAMSRGTSVYFANRVIPMIPKELSNGVCSLNPGEDKLCLSAIIKLDLNGQIKKYKFAKTVINSKVKGIYSEVNEILEGTASEELKEKYAQVKHSIKLCFELSKTLKANTKQRSAMDLDSTESKFILDENGVCIGLKARESGPSQELIEELMICANRCAAMFSEDNELPFIYRVHGEPSPKKLTELCDVLKALEIPHKELYKENPSSTDFQKILDNARGTKNESAVSQRVLRAMEKAKYSHIKSYHFGLALKDYSHFTSPIRRYPDTSIHRIITEFLRKKDANAVTKRFKNFVETSAKESSVNELRAVRAQRDTEDCYMAEYMLAHIGEKFDGVISGVTKNGLFVRLENSAEGFVPIESFKNNNFYFDGVISHICKITGRKLSLGDPLNIIVAAARVATGSVDFAPDED